ncbi:unnamed protein product, partial [Didymodactylos carnosus]
RDSTVQTCAFCTCPLTADGHKVCWNSTQCQIQCTKECQTNCLYESLTDKKCCHTSCAGGCINNSIFQCNACEKLRIYSTGECVQTCPYNYYLVKDTFCVTYAECLSSEFSHGQYILNSNCVDDCPHGYKVSHDHAQCIPCESTKSNNYCNGTCAEKHIRLITDFQQLKYCHRIQTLNIYEISVASGGDGTSAQQLQSVNEALDNLKSIEYIENEFTLHNNYIPLDKTSKYFCLESSSMSKMLIVSNDTMNSYANGYLASCESNSLSLTVDKITSTSATVYASLSFGDSKALSTAFSDLRRPFFSVYYKPTRNYQNETHFDASSLCSKNPENKKWFKKVEKINYDPSSEKTSISLTHLQLLNLDGDQLYAAYGSVTSNIHMIGMFSPIIYFKTSKRQPDSIVNLRGYSTSKTTIELQWNPPLKTHGQIEYYLIYYGHIYDKLPIKNSKMCATLDVWHMFNFTIKI